MTTVVPIHATSTRPATLPRGGGGRARRPGGAAEAERLAAALARWYAEALAGRRDTRPLRDLLTPAVSQRVRCAVLREAARRHAGQRSQSAVVTVRRTLVQPFGDRFEATVVVDDGRRATAIAATLHERGDGWLVSELARPEDGLPALRTPWMAPLDAD